MGCAHSAPPTTDAEPFAELEGFTDGIEAPTAEELSRNVARVQARLRELSYGALIVEPGATMEYLSAVQWWRSERVFLLILPADAAPLWICPAFEESRARERIGEDGDILVWQEHEDPYSLIYDGLSKRGLREASLAIEPGVRHFVVEATRRKAPNAQLVDGQSVTSHCRMRKSAAELARLKRANEATKAALKAASSHAKEGMTERELKTLIVSAQETAGLEEVWALVLFGPNAAYPHGTGQEHRLAEGDAILIDTGGRLHGYCSDITRTWVLGRPSAELRKAWDTVRAAQQAAFELIRPGILCAQPEAAARELIVRAGYGPDYRFFTHRLGHGIGLEGHEDPYLVRGNDLALAPGMTMSNEPGIYVPGKFGIRIEDIVAVTEDGHEIFGPQLESLDHPF